jgi:hypothetical protein
VKSPLFCTVFTLDLQQTLNNQAAIMKFRPDKSIISIRVGEIGKAKDLSASHIGNEHCKNLILPSVHVFSMTT